MLPNADRVHHLDLSRRPRAPRLRRDQTPALLVFWWHSLPLGHHWVEPADLPLTDSAFRHAVHTACAPAFAEYAPDAASTALDTDVEPTAWSQAMDRVAALGPAFRLPAASVVVATRDRPDRLMACLRSVAQLNPPPAEVIVVDSAPQHHPVDRVAAAYGARYAYVARPGASAARNVGAQMSTQPVVAYVDDDEILHPAWLSRLTAPLDAPDVALVTGLVLPRALGTKASVLFEKRFSFIRGYRPRTFDAAYFQRHKHRGVPVWQLGGSGNMAVRRELFLRLGGFDERLGAGRAGCSEDTEFFYRLLAAGHTCRYEPRAVAFHYHRSTHSELKRQLQLYMRGHVTSLLTQHRRHGHAGNLRQLAYDLPREYLKAAAKSLLGRPGYAPDLLYAELSGCLSGLAYYHRHRRDFEPKPLPALPAEEEFAPMAEVLS